MVLLTFGVMFVTNAKTCYVRTDGSNLNKGDSNTPKGAWETMTFAFAKLTAGDTLFFADGIYNEIDPITSFKGGSKTIRTTIKSINKWGAKIICNSTHQAIRLHSDGVIFDGFDVTWVPNPSSAHNGVEFQGNWITVRNCNIHDIPFGGIQGAFCDNVLIENNHCYNNFSSTGSENGSGISIWCPKMFEENSGGFNIIIRSNICYNNWATTAVGSTGKPTDGNGIIIDDFHGDQMNQPNYIYKTLVENNLCYNNGGRGILIFASDNVTIQNNTVYYNNYILKDFWDTGDLQIDGGINNAFYNNISVTNYALSTRPVALKVTTDNGTTKICNNLLCGNPFSFWSASGLKTSLTSGGNSNNITKSDVAFPAFVNPDTDAAIADFHLKNSSPAINKGNNAFGSETDLDGNIRPQDKTTDLGCYKYLSSTGSNELRLEPTDLIPKLNIFPNPVIGDSFTIFMNENSKAKDNSVSIFDLTGKVFYETILEQQQKEISIPTSRFPKAGIYLVRVTKDKMVFTGKFIVS